MHLLRCLICELIGTAFLLATVVGSGALLHNIDSGNVAVTVLGVAIATAFILLTLINTLGSTSAQFNPIVALMSALQGNLPWKQVPLFVAAQISGAIAGVLIANCMFEVPIAISQTARAGYGQWLGEFVASFGLVATIIGCSRSKPDAVPQSVAAYVGAAILFTSSTCFANPAVSISRIFTTTITGIRPGDVPAFIVFELAGAALAYLVFSWLIEERKPTIPDRLIVEPDLRKRLEQELSAQATP